MKKDIQFRAFSAGYIVASAMWAWAVISAGQSHGQLPEVIPPPKHANDPDVIKVVPTEGLPERIRNAPSEYVGIVKTETVSAANSTTTFYSLYLIGQKERSYWLVFPTFAEDKKYEESWSLNEKKCRVVGRDGSGGLRRFLFVDKIEVVTDGPTR